MTANSDEPTKNLSPESEVPLRFIELHCEFQVIV